MNYDDINNILYDGALREGAVRAPTELLLQDHPYASLYFPTQLYVESPPQPVETPSFNYDAVSSSDRNVRPKELTTRTKNIHSVKKRDELKRKLPQPIETPSFVLYASAVQKSALHMPQKSDKLDQNDDTSGVMAKRLANHQKLRYNNESSTFSDKSKSVDSSNHETNRPETNEPAREKTKRPRNDQQPPTPKPGSSSIDNLQWMALYERLVCFKTKHETSFVPRNDRTYPKLAKWVQIQIQSYQMGTLKKEHEQLLISVGFYFHEFRKHSFGTWSAMFHRYNAHREIYHDVTVFRVAARDPELGNWMKNQRALNKRGILKTDRKRKMDAVGFDWNIRQWNSWEDMFGRLKVFWMQNGSCNVSRSRGNDNKLANWVLTQRSRLFKHTISEEQIKLLNTIDFDWRAPVITTVGNNAKGRRNPASCPVWEATYDRYKAYKKKHDPVITSEVKKADPKLANWMKNQRLTFNTSVMQEDRMHRLKGIGFDFRVPPSEKWKTNFEKLQTFWNQHGHTKVARGDDPQLCTWARTQRQRHNIKTILEEQVRMLNNLGFDWKINTKRGRTPGSRSNREKSNAV
jgi:hypothetical protein